MSEKLTLVEQQDICRCKLQAIAMAAFAGLDISEQQAISYYDNRMDSGNRPLMSDQKVLYKLLTPEQRHLFEQAYKHMSFYDINPNNLDYINTNPDVTTELLDLAKCG